MFKTLRDKITLSGVTVLIIGAALLVFTFASAYGFLTQSLSILTSSDLAQTFGEALAPLIATCIRVMYLGIMGWIGSLLTIRGVTMLSQARQMPEVALQERVLMKKAVKEEVREEPKPIPKVKEEKPKEEKPKEEPKKPEAKPYEPEIIVLTPEKAPQPQQAPQQEPQQQPKQEQAASQ